MNRLLLVVDDDPVYSEFVREVADRYHDSVISASNADAAVSALEEQAVDMILCDLELPMMGGLAFQAALAKEGRFQKIPFVFMASSTGPEVVRYARDIPNTRLILKSDLIHALSDILGP